MGKTTVYRSWVKKTAKYLFQQVDVRKKYIVQKYFLEDTYKRKLQHMYLPMYLANHAGQVPTSKELVLLSGNILKIKRLYLKFVL